MADASSLLRVLDALYAAVLDPAHWPAFLEVFSDALGGGPVALFLDQPGTPRSGLSFDARFRPDVDVDFNAEFRLRHPFLAPLASAPTGVVLRLDQLVSHQELAGSELYQRLLVPEGLAGRRGYVILLHRDREGPLAAIVCFPDPHGAAVEQEELLEALAPHLLRARQLFVDRARFNSAADALLEALDRLLLGVVLLDDDGQVIFSNRSARDVIEREACLELRNRRLHASLPERDQELQQRMREAAALPDRSAESGIPDAALTLAGLDGKVDLLVTGLRQRASQHSFGTATAAAVFLSGPRSGAGDTTAMLQTLYALTPAEARLATLIAADRSIEQAADQLGIKTSSARTVLKRIFAKTGTSRQASLVRLLVSGPALLRASEGSRRQGSRRQ